MSPARLLSAALLVSALVFAAAPAMAQLELPQDVVMPDGLNPKGDPLDSLRPPGDDPNAALDKAFSELPEEPAPTVIARDRPRTEEPMEDYTQYFEKKVFGVPEGKKNETLTYFFKPPPKSKKEGTYPLILFLHNDKGVSHAAEHMIRGQLRKSFPAYLVVPVLPANQIWSFPKKFPDDPKLEINLRKAQGLPSAVKLVSDLITKEAVDPQRVYVVGCGDGGFGVFGAATKFSDVFAAGVPMSGGWTVKEAPQMVKFPLFVFHGADDKKFEPGLSRNVAYYIQQFGGRKVSFVEVPGMGHDCSNPMMYTAATWQWLFQQKR